MADPKPHFLLERAHVFPLPDAPLEPPGYVYDLRLGAWVRTVDGKPELLVQSPDPRPRPVTKKADQETGEDLKGE